MDLHHSGLIQGGVFEDIRGRLAFVNDLDLSPVKRFYLISHPNTETIRAWQGHQVERKWFYCTKGAFTIKLVKIDNWLSPSKGLEITSFVLTEDISAVLAVDGGYATGIQATEPNSSLLVFSDKNLEEAKEDDFRFEKDYWFTWH